MFDDLFKSAEEKAKAEAAQHFDLGMKHLEGKFFNRAMMEFKKAMDLAHEEVYPRLMQELDNTSNSGQLEAALAIGLNLLKENQQDYELANKLGNFAREMENFNQAESLYKMALRVNKNFEKAFYNLAACAARIPIYDDQVKSSISIFDKVDDYVLPDSIGEDPAPPAKLLAKLEEGNTKLRETKIAEFTAQIAAQEELGNNVEASHLKMEMDHFLAEPQKVGPKQVVEEFMRLIEAEPEKASQHRYNLGLYALINHLPNMAQDAFGALSAGEFDLLELLQAIALDQGGHLDEAIDKVNRILGANEFNRYSNVNLGLMFKKGGKRFLATKYLVKTAALLEKSGGLYSMRELVKIAYASIEEGNLKKAQNFLAIAVTEIHDPALWLKLGEVLVELKKYDEATEALRQVLKMDPENQQAPVKLKEIHDYYAEKGLSLQGERKFKAAAEYLHKALTVLRLPETLKAAATVFKELHNYDKADELILELHEIEQKEKERLVEVERQNKIGEAKAAMQKRNFRAAAELLESALRMKVDKNVFLQLSAIYKALKKFEDLDSLSQRWAKMLEHEEKLKLYEREKERALTGD